jgi:multiple sugar transport system permease protein
MLGRRVATVGSTWRPDATVGSRWSELLNNQKFIAVLFLTPALAVLVFVVIYPFFSAIWISFHDKMVGAPARFIGLANYYELFADAKFLQVVRNTLVYTFAAVAIKFCSGSAWPWS